MTGTLRIVVCCLLMSLASCRQHSADGNGNVTSTKEAQPVSVNFCDLIKSPKAFDGKEVRVKAVYRYGFEWSELYSLQCVLEEAGEHYVWMEGTRASCKSPDVLVGDMAHVGPNGRTVGVIAIGTFHS